MFPLGLPGLALLLLRVSVALTLLLCAYVRVEGPAAWLLAGSSLLATLLVLGLLTPVVAVIAIGAQLMSLSGLTGPLAAIIGVAVLNTVALALLGPGAYSIDASRFGRRVVDLPSADDE